MRPAILDLFKEIEFRIGLCIVVILAVAYGIFYLLRAIEEMRFQQKVWNYEYRGV